MLWLAYHNSEIDWKTEEVKMMRYPEKCRRQWRLKQGKSEWEKQKEEEWKEEEGKKQEEKKKKKNKKIKGSKVIDMKKIAEEWEIWDEKEEAVRLAEEIKKLVLEQFHKQIKVFGKKQNVGLCNRSEGGICIEEREGISVIKREKRGGVQVHIGTTEERVYQTLKVTSNGTSVFCGKKE